MVGIKAPPTGEMMDNNGKPIYFDSIDNSAYILGKAEHSARTSWIYVDGENFNGIRVDVNGDPGSTPPGLHHAWKYLWTLKDSWLGATANTGGIGATYNLTMDPYEKYDMTFNGAVSMRNVSTSPGKYAGWDNAWLLGLVGAELIEFDKSIMKYPNIKRFPGGASNDLAPNLQNPENPVPGLDTANPPKAFGAGGG
jgi:arylsulfatase